VAIPNDFLTAQNPPTPCAPNKRRLSLTLSGVATRMADSAYGGFPCHITPLPVPIAVGASSG